LHGLTGSLFSCQCDSVWPGDANADGVADNFDVLALAVNFGDTGSARPVPSNAWAAQVGRNWNDSLVNGVNSKHSDCDGSGTINADDTLAVALNYGLMHTRSVPQEYQATWPDFSLHATPDSVGLNQVIHLKFCLGIQPCLHRPSMA
jgi:hypothetical protein